MAPPGPTPVPKNPTRQWLANWLPLAGLILLALWVWISRLLAIHRPPVGLYIGVLAFVAGVVTIWPPEHPWAKAAWFLVFGGFLVLEITTLYQQRHEDEVTADTNRKVEDASFKKVLTENQAEFQATVSQMKDIANLSTQAMNEATGGDSFCYLDIGGISSGLTTTTFVMNIVQSGRYPVFQVDVNVSDIDAAESSHFGNIDTWRRSFPAIPVITRVSLYRPIATYSIKSEEKNRKFNIEIHARNGVFTELLRLQRLEEGGSVVAQIVDASYFTKQHGIVLRHVHPKFPMDILDSDKDWRDFNKFRRIAVAQ